MGVPKQKWTSEEEAALKAGIAKYGPGRWSTILKDSEFASVLHMRSNVDLKDKWRNINFMGSGYGSRQRSRPPKSQPVHKPESISTSSKEERNALISIPDPLPILALPVQIDDSKKPMPIQRLDSIILESITNLKESCGSSRAAIAEYIEKKQSTPPIFERLLKEELKAMIDCGKLIKVKHRYRMAASCVKKRSSPLILEAKKEEMSGNNRRIITKEEIDAELEKMKKMTPQQAAAAAVKAVAEAEAAILEAERAEREAELAEADAELARGLAAAAISELKKTAIWTW